MIYLSNDPYPQEISIPRSFGVIVPRRTEYLTGDDIATNLETDSDRKVLAASQGVRLKEMVDGKADASDVYTKQQVDSALANKADTDSVYTKQQTDTLLGGKQDTLTPGENIRIENNVISADVPEVDAYTRQETDDLLALKADKADTYTKQQVDTALAGKQDTINDLQTIRDGAAAGATAYQKPQTGIPASDLANGVIPTIPVEDVKVGGTSVVNNKVAEIPAIPDSVEANPTIPAGVTPTDLQNLKVGDDFFSVPQGGGVDLSTDVVADRNSNAKASTPKSVFDALGKWGVISQTQTWAGNDNTGYNYTMSNPVWGMIPQANIDLYASVGAVFNDTTGYFELNGLTDISYNEMKQIYSDTIGCAPLMLNRGLNLTGTKARTNIPMVATTTYGITLNFLAYANGMIEVIAFRDNMQINNTLSASFHSCRRLRKIIGIIILAVATGTHSSVFNACASLEEITLKGIKIGIPFPNSPRLSLESVVYMVENATNTAAITITLHATAYARCLADTTEYTYQGNTYAGILAYASARNITIASA